jgi:hypothetical protein
LKDSRAKVTLKRGYSSEKDYKHDVTQNALCAAETVCEIASFRRPLFRICPFLRPIKGQFKGNFRAARLGYFARLEHDISLVSWGLPGAGESLLCAIGAVSAPVTELRRVCLPLTDRGSIIFTVAALAKRRTGSQENINVDFNRSNLGLLSPMRPAKLAPADEPTDDMLVTEPVIGPAERSRPSIPNPMSVEAPGIDPGGSLAAELHWGIPKTAPHVQPPYERDDDLRTVR